MIAPPATCWSQPAYRGVAELVGRRTGLAFSESRVADAEASIRRAMGRTGALDLDSYLRDLEGGTAFEELIAELVVGESYFFREPLQWQVLREELLPALRQQRPPGQPLRIWSAGCASGEEPYSMAILLEEEGLAAGAQLLATDLSRAALRRAEAASYGAWSLRGVDRALVERYFTADGPRFQLNERFRQRVWLEALNLALDPYPSFANGTWRLDLILCRNVLIYLDPETVRRVLRQFHDCLAPGGWLVTGPSDPLVEVEGFESVVTRAGIFCRRRAVELDRVHPSPGRRPEPEPEPEPEPVRMNPGANTASASSGSTEPPPEIPDPSDPLAEARAAFARGDYHRALTLASALPGAEAAALCVRAAANGAGAGEAGRRVASALARYPQSEELQLLHAVLLLERGQPAEAAQAARRALYLDRTLAMGHFLLGAALARAGDPGGAQQAFRNTRALCAQLPPDAAVRFGDGQRADRLAEAAAAQLDLLAPRRGS